ADASSVGQLTGAGLLSTGQTLDKDWTFTGHPRLQPDCTSTAPRLHLCCTCAAQGLPTRARHRRSGEKNDVAGRRATVLANLRRSHEIAQNPLSSAKSV